MNFVSNDQIDPYSLSILRKGQKLKAYLIGVYMEPKGEKACLEHLEELEDLAKTVDLEVVQKKPCHLRKMVAATFLTSGKLEECIDEAIELKADILIFDDEIMPSQQRNLEKEFEGIVMDRTELILEVFSRNAKTKEARLQIALAQTQYQFPRLKRLWTHLSRQKGGALYLKGEGEKQVELDRRMLKDRVAKLKKELSQITHTRKQKRKGRERQEIPTFALVGYTNAGKSTLLNTLTDAGVLAEDRLFATLDTTTRKFTLPNNQKILITDTVGFIRKLPHRLIAAFRSTLEEAVYSDVLIQVIDCSHENGKEQALATKEVLKELGAEESAMIHILNKIDLVEDKGRLMKWKVLFPRLVFLSAKTEEGCDELIQRMVEEVEKSRKDLFLRIPQKEYHVVAKLIQDCKVHEQLYEGNDVLIHVNAPIALAEKFRKYEETREEAKKPL